MEDDEGQGGEPTGGETSDKGKAAMVPSSRLREETKLKREALARAAELEQEIANLTKKAGTVDTLATQFRDLQARHEAERMSWEEERGIYQSGLTDPEAIGVARHLYGQIPEASRKPFVEQVRTWREKVDEAPKALRPYLQPPASPVAPQAPSQPQGQPSRAAGGAAPTSGQPAAAGQWTAEQIKEMRLEAQRTGDWSRYKEARGGILASISRR